MMIREKNGGWEFVLKRSKIRPEPFRHYNQDREAGELHMRNLTFLLDNRGVIPDEYKIEGGRKTGNGEKYETVYDLINLYRKGGKIKDSDMEILGVIRDRVGATLLRDINYDWVESYILEMKIKRNLSPTTIKHHCGALSRAINYGGNKGIVALLVNPFLKLPRGYAQYSAREATMAKSIDSDFGKKEDNARTRRLENGEEERIRAVLARNYVPEKERMLEIKHQGALELMFDLALETAMRMREMYTLTWGQVSYEKATIFLTKTKNGTSREVPLSSVAITKLKIYTEQVLESTRGMEGFAFEQDRIFPWWTTERTFQGLRQVSAKLSNQYSRIFEAAGCDNLNFHDLRHEATSRLFEYPGNPGGRPLSEAEIRKITGHKTARMGDRYNHLRGSDLAGKLW